MGGQALDAGHVGQIAQRSKADRRARLRLRRHQRVPVTGLVAPGPGAKLLCHQQGGLHNHRAGRPAILRQGAPRQQAAQQQAQRDKHTTATHNAPPQ